VPATHASPCKISGDFAFGKKAVGLAVAEFARLREMAIESSREFEGELELAAL
jgi:hypothetical protein